MDHVDVLLAGQFASVEAFDHLTDVRGIAREREQVNFVAVDQSVRDTGVPQAVYRSRFTLRPVL
jgi:hypothetical protein